MTTPSTITRRTLTKGAAWSVPVVALASSAPAAAASGPESCLLVLEVSVQSTVTVGSAVFDMSLSLTSGGCADGAQFMGPIQAAFDVPSPYNWWMTHGLFPHRAGSAPRQEWVEDFVANTPAVDGGPVAISLTGLDQSTSELPTTPIAITFSATGMLKKSMMLDPTV